MNTTETPEETSARLGLPVEWVREHNRKHEEAARIYMPVMPNPDGDDAYFEEISTHQFADDREPQILSLTGSVSIRQPRIWPRRVKTYDFGRLTRFAQGYTQAMLTDLLFFQPHVQLVRFAMIHPPTLARIIKDCKQAWVSTYQYEYGEPETKGMAFWVDRLNASFDDPALTKTFRPLTPFLTRSGRVIFELSLGSGSMDRTAYHALVKQVHGQA